MRTPLLFCILSLAVPAAWPIAPAASGPCDHPAPRDFEAVYACMSAYRSKNLDGSVGTSRFAHLQGLACRQIAKRYLRALTRVGGMTPSRARQYLPSCALFAQAVEKLTDEPPSWGKCLDAKGGFDDAHFRSCLEYFLPRQRKGGRRPRTLSAVSSCKEAIDAYERALRSADRGGNLPPGYSEPQCTRIAAALRAASPGVAQDSSASPFSAGSAAAAQPGTSGPPPRFAACLGYDPAQVETHLRRCLGEDLSAFRDCPQVREVYEKKLIDAYGGSLPAGYILLGCEQAADVLRVADAQRVAQRAEEERKRAEAQRARNERAMARAAERERLAAQRQRAAERSEADSDASAQGSWALFAFVVAFIAALLYLFRKKKIRPTVTVYGWTYEYVKAHLIHRSGKKPDDDETSDAW